MNESLILYSYKLNLIENLNFENKEYDNFYIINELNEFPEFKSISIILYNNIIENKEITKKLVNKVINTLNSSTLIKIKKLLISYDKIPETIKRLKKRVNEYMIGKKISNSEIDFINSISNKYKYNLKLTFPKITANDLVFLFCKLDDNESIVPNMDDKDFILDNFELKQKQLENLIDINNDDNNKLEECVKKLIEICLEPNNQKLKLLFDKILIMAKQFDNKDNNIKFDLLDYKLILENKTRKFDFFDRFPLTYFWFIQNSKYADGEIFLKLYKKEEKENILLEEKLPFWLFCIRMHSSLNYIISDYFSYLDFQLKCILYNIIYVKIQNKKNIGIKWINLLKFVFLIF